MYCVRLVNENEETIPEMHIYSSSSSSVRGHGFPSRIAYAIKI